MGLLFKKEETYKLAAKLAELTNEIMRKAVAIAPREDQDLSCRTKVDR